MKSINKLKLNPSQYDDTREHKYTHFSPPPKNYIDVLPLAPNLVLPCPPPTGGPKLLVPRNAELELGRYRIEPDPPLLFTLDGVLSKLPVALGRK